MGKKAQGAPPNLNSVVNKDVFHRMNFLYQASAFLNSVESLSESVHTRPRTKWRRMRKAFPPDSARIYVQSMMTTGRKTLVKMDPSVKRAICRGCGGILIPGLTATIRIKSSSSHCHAVTYTCISCTTVRRIPAPPTLSSRDDGSIATGINNTSAEVTRGETENTPTMKTVNKRKKRRPPIPHLPPLFERDVGHVVFCRDEIQSEEA